MKGKLPTGLWPSRSPTDPSVPSSGCQPLGIAQISQQGPTLATLKKGNVQDMEAT